jgi:hypothetical protein
MITLNDLVNEYGDMPLNEDVIRLFGIVEPKEIDKLLRIEEVQIATGIKNGSIIIRRLKAKYGLEYNEAVIPASIIAKEYGMKTQDVINYIEETKNRLGKVG